MIENWYEVMGLYLQSQRVIGLRTAVISRGGQTARDETAFMVIEKSIAASCAFQMIFAGFGGTVLAYYNGLVAANINRLEAVATDLSIV